MSTPQSSDDLFQLIRKSGLVDEQKLTGFLRAHERDGLLQQDTRNIVATMVREGLITFFQGEQFLLGKWKGFTLGKFKLLERIGVGGMGQVFLCEHTYMRRRVAIKVLPPSKAGDPVSLGRFYREARVASALEHPHVVRTFDIDQDGPLHFLVMEYVDGTSLLEIVKKLGPLNVLRSCHYIRQACLGLQYAYAAGMIHRDIKPGNIMVERKGTAKLLDMGLARFYRDEKDQLTLKYDDKNVLGTADYVAPEQTRDSRNIDIRADIYGMGATFYYVLTGQPPFPEATIADKLIAHQTKKARPVRELRPEVPPGVSKIIEKMLAKDPKDRYQTPQEVADALEVWTQQPIDPPPVEEMPKLSPAATDPSFMPPPPPAPIQARDESSVRPEVPVANRSVSSPEFKLPDITPAALEDARTVPVPPAAPRPAVATMSRPLPGGPETRPLTAASDPTPQPGSRSAPEAFLGYDGPAKRPSGLPGSHPGVQPGSHLGITPGARPRPSDLATTPDKSVLPPLRPSALGTMRLPPHAPVPPASPPSTPKPPSKHNIELPKLRSFQGMANPNLELSPSAPPRVPDLESPRPPSVEAFRIQLPAAAPVAPSIPLPGPGNRPQPPRLPPVAPPVLTSPVGFPKGTPTYQPPTTMPFFDTPIGPAQPGLFTKLMRWLFMITVSSITGAALGVAIWHLFLRPH
jgi:serine/threonine protein kinase